MYSRVRKGWMGLGKCFSKMSMPFNKETRISKMSAKINSRPKE
jgi:hypothetical protein